jgi:hypothetical protein
MDTLFGGGGSFKYFTGQARPSVAAGEMLQNWLTSGGPPKPVDPTDLFSQATATQGVREKASAGMGIGGLFGFTKYLGSMFSPMSKGVPYSVPPLPKLPGMAGGSSGGGPPVPPWMKGMAR